MHPDRPVQVGGGVAHRPGPRREPIALYAIFLAALLIDIGGTLGLKYGSAALLVFFAVLSARRVVLPRSVVIVEGAIFLVVPTLLLASAVAYHRVPIGDAASALTFLTTWAVFPLLVLIPRRQMVSVFAGVMYWGAVATLAVFGILVLLFAAGRLDVVSAVSGLAERLGLGFVGQRPLPGGISLMMPNVYFRWTMLLIPAAAVLVGSRRLWVVIAAVCATLSTGTIVFAIAGVLLGVVMDPERRVGRLLVAAMIGGGVVAVAGVVLMSTAYGEVLLTLVEKFSAASDSTSQKLGHIQSIIALLTESERALLTGTGVGSTFYSRGVEAEVWNVEVSHFNLLRQFGAVYTLLFFGYVAYVAARLLGSDLSGRRLGVGLVMIFVAAGTNPLLLSPVFFLVLAIGRAYTLDHAREAHRAATPRLAAATV